MKYKLLIIINRQLYTVMMMKIKGKIQKQGKQSSSQYNLSDNVEEEESFLNDYCYIRQERKNRQKLRKSTALKRKNHGSWSPNEEKKFIEFMKKKRPIFEDKELRRTHKIFKEMARFLKSRSSEQCRSHHQKYEIKLKSFDNIIAYVEGKIIDLQAPRHMDLDSKYDFLNVAGCEWQNNPVYTQKAKIGPNLMQEPQEFCLINKVNFKTGHQHDLINTEPVRQVIAETSGEWKLFMNRPNCFSIQIKFDSFL